MQNNKRTYKLLVISVIILMCGIIGSSYIFTIQEIEGIYKEAGQDGLLDMKKVYLKDTVDNLIFRIDELRNYETMGYESIINEAKSYINQIESSNDFIELATMFFYSESKIHLFDAIIMDNKTNEIIYSNRIELARYIDYSDLARSLYETYSVYHIEATDQYRIFFGVTKAEIDRQVKEQISNEIHQTVYSDNSYIWVNEILDYSGGDGYAIRLIHPNLIDTEGALLSTNTTDIMGNYPYRTELNGVNASGSIYYTYYFKQLNSDQITEKLTYSKLYADFNWVVSMGADLDSIDEYLTFTQEQSNKHMMRLIINIVILVLFLTFVSTFFLIFVDKWHNMKERKELENEILYDGMTKAYSRNAAVKNLNVIFKNRKKVKNKVALILIDVDDFKNINDHYGHDKGDLVLKIIVETIKSNIRQTDKLYRWGGEEFLLTGEGLDLNNIVKYCEKMLHYVSEISGEGELLNINISVSMGVTFLEISDYNFEEALKRADMALYDSKRNGKNQATYRFKDIKGEGNE
ncbi:diguanylate cyclase [Fusibacter bizertensis]